MSERSLLRRRIRSGADVVDIEGHRPAELRPADTILGCLRAAAARRPEKAAIVLVEPPDLLSGARTLTYAELVTGIERTADLFHDVAAGARSTVGLVLPMLPEGLVALWGAQTAGVAVPVNPFLEPSSLARILVQAGVTAVVTTPEILESKGGVGGLHELVPSLRRVFCVGDADTARDLMTAAARYAGCGLTFTPDDDPERDAVVMPTGGTTGTPKLVRMSQAGQLTVAWNVGALMGNEPDTVTAHGMPNFHCGGTISLGLRTLLFGGTLLTLTREGFRSRGAVTQFWDVARQYGVTSLLATPTTAAALLDTEGTADGCRVRDFHVGGNAVPMDLVQRFHRRFGIWLRENWGMTELHGTTTGHFDDGEMPRVGSVGRPLPYVRVKVVELSADGRWVRDCAPGERGLLLTGTPTATAGYLDSRLDAELFPAGLPDDLPAGWRWGNTGDIGTVDDDGYVWIFGRAKDVIIRGGHNIDPKEIEDVLATHPTVHLVAAVGRPDRLKGELPIAYVQLRDTAAVEAADLLAYCRKHVGERAAVPVEVIVLDRMPLTPVGKISKPALRADALMREIRRAVADVVADMEVVVDNSGQRQRVVIHVPDARFASEVQQRLVGYEVDIVHTELPHSGATAGSEGAST